MAALQRAWPDLARRTSGLLTSLGDSYRHLARGALEMAEPLSPGEQTARYARAAPALASAAAEQALTEAGIGRETIGLLLVTSCTGFILPGLDAHLVPALGLRPDVWRLPITQLGCAGGSAGLARAADWTRSHPGQRALVVSVELPSLTFRPGDHSIDNLLSALVFGDGAGAAVLEGGSTTTAGFRIGRVRSVLAPGTTAALGYDLADDGFRVILSRQLPAVLATALPGVVRDFCDAGDPAALDAVALHPGGRTIVTAVQQCLGLADHQLAATRAAMRTTGNTSSAAIFFVLETLSAAPPVPTGRGLVLGFGPGITIELLELTWGS